MFDVEKFRALMHEMSEHYGVSGIRVVKRRKGYITAKITNPASLDTCQSLLNRVCNLSGCFNELKRCKADSVTFSISY